MIEAAIAPTIKVSTNRFSEVVGSSETIEVSASQPTISRIGMMPIAARAAGQRDHASSTATPAKPSSRT